MTRYEKAFLVVCAVLALLAYVVLGGPVPSLMLPCGAHCGY